MKLLIQIPCYNEEKTLASVLESIPRSIEGIDEIQTLIINDGSDDNTVEVAREAHVNHIINNTGNKGLAYSFSKGLEFALDNKYDILINTDGDNQYPSKYISHLVQPIINKEADIVIGDRQTSKINHFSTVKKFFQWFGTKITQIFTGDNSLRDAVSGFRAYSRAAMIELNVTSDFSYILDTTVQASNKKIKTVTIPITTNNPTRPSRLFSNMWEHMWKSGKQILRVYALYKPLKVFFSLGIIIFIIGSIPIIRFLYSYFTGDGNGHIQSLIIGGTLLSVSVNLFALGIIGDLMSKNRHLIEQLLRHTKRKS